MKDLFIDALILRSRDLTLLLFSSVILLMQFTNERKSIEVVVISRVVVSTFPWGVLHKFLPIICYGCLQLVIYNNMWSFQLYPCDMHVKCNDRVFIKIQVDTLEFLQSQCAHS